MPPLRDSGIGPEAERPEYAGQYRLETRLGAGGMGVVHLARSSSGLLLAVKVIHAEFAQDPEFRGRFRQEVTAARRVSGAFTAPVVDADPEAERPWMATLHIPGPTLSHQVKRNGPMAPAEVRRLAAGLAEALRDIHRAGVVHRDLKPGNVLLAADGPKVIDFGISRPSDSEMRTETGKLIGTPPFMAPEQFQRPREVGPAADVFALGSVLVHAATGRGPFDSESPYLVAYQVVHDDADLSGVPEELVPLVESCLAKDPADRPTPGALMELLRTDTSTAVPATLPMPPTDTGVDTERGTDPGAVAAASASTGTGTGTGTRIPGQRQPVRDASAPPRAEATHVRARTPELSTAPEPPRETAAARETTPSHTPDPPAGTSNPDPGPSPSGGSRRRLIWAALALAVTAVGAVAGVRALTAADDADDPALQTRAQNAPRTAFHPWRTTLVKRPAGYAAEMPFCTSGAGGLFCGQSGLLASRIDPDTGTAAWQHKADTTHKPAVSPTAPVLSGGLLYVFSPDARQLLALDPSAHGSGATRWTKDLSSYQGGAVVVGDRILLSSGDGTVTALDSTTHQERWRKRFPGHRLPVFTAYGDPHTAYAAEAVPDGRTPTTQVTAINPSDGTIHWSHRLPGSLALAGTGSSGALYLTATDPTFVNSTTGVVRYDPGTRQVRKLPLAAPLRGVAAVVRGETVYLLAEGGALQAVGARTWDTETSVSRGSAPIVSGDRLYFTAADGRLIAVDTTSGALLGQTQPRLAAARHNGFLQALPAPSLDSARDRIYAASPDGTVFGVPTGDPRRW
ncbi:protein kinase domain-containing protein [Streptomyces sp. GS7]|uniref:protein kinase domain-containing protein n=1 Tax=Streptomyces sp. GS7 TaxID=2692234 RepID=UPI001317350F|nr:PQQ-binding-like beta-propeller repeat protein [Streptomyces sp. GS7]QHC26112.1 PQQ-binding-like beta-propeller repeat protein [Streptomyces sp. GS7]